MNSRKFGNSIPRFLHNFSQSHTWCWMAFTTLPWCHHLVAIGAFFANHLIDCLLNRKSIRNTAAWHFTVITAERKSRRGNRNRLLLLAMQMCEWSEIFKNERVIWWIRSLMRYEDLLMSAINNVQKIHDKIYGRQFWEFVSDAFAKISVRRSHISRYSPVWWTSLNQFEFCLCSWETQKKDRQRYNQDQRRLHAVTLLNSRKTQMSKPRGFMSTSTKVLVANSLIFKCWYQLTMLTLVQQLINCNSQVKG